MRLLRTNVESLRLRLFMPGSIPNYVILSHVWGDEEIQFEDFTKEGLLDPNGRVMEKKGLSKLEGACALAARDGYEWIWIDTCCIDKSSSAELQEAINSMWRYYAESNICYVYMVDIPDYQSGWTNLFCGSRWFTRGWTLQELIAPTSVEFYARDWSAIGTKLQRYQDISKTTSINPGVLTHLKPVAALSAAERLSWAAHRRVTREEDESYCLFGIFDVNMPMIYGEGRRKAFFRLQEAIYNSTFDHSLFLFRESTIAKKEPLLADALARFCPTNCPYCGSWSMFSDIPYDRLVVTADRQLQGYDRIRKTVTFSQDLVSTTLRLFDYSKVSDRLRSLGGLPLKKRIASHAAILDYTLDDVKGGAVCLLLIKSSKHESENFVRLSSPSVIIPNLAEFRTKLYLLPVVVASGAEFRNGYVLTCFTFTGEPFTIRRWNIKGAFNEQE